MTKPKRMILIAMLGAISGILMILDFNVPFVPVFIKFDISDLPIIVGGYLMGVVPAILIGLLKIIINLLINGTTTMFIGEIANFLLSILYALPAVLYYEKHKTRQGKIIGLILSTMIVSIVGIIINLLLLFPIYLKLLGLSVDDIVQMASALNPLVKNLPTMVVFTLLPFNLLKYGINSILCYVVVKKMKVLIKNID